MLSPLIFDPIYKEKVWGGNRLAVLLDKDISPRAKIGESWEISGFGNDISCIAEGPLTGTRLSDLFMNNRDELVGGAGSADTFPLLYKYIDARERLSVQVHPDDAQARSNGWGAFGKTECWYVVHADPGTQMVAGFNRPVSSEDIEESLQKHSLPDLLNFIDVKQGDVLFIPAGTVHATLSGALLFEIQETSDTTFRFYDWDRNDPARPLHIEESLAVVDKAFHNRHTIQPVPFECMKGIECRYRVACSYFSIIEHQFTLSTKHFLPPRQSFQVITVLNGEVEITGESFAARYTSGRNILIPSVQRKIAVSADPGAHLLVSWIPDLHNDVIAPLRRQGISDETIRCLGGNPLRNDLDLML
ncbi:MAG: hypothetical protein GF350_01075 [Chitinivibrionales bacterium]|nr:hypothetical protein [Chitinivibrionales bacterium]